MKNKGKYYITTAIAYASGKPHIGNTYEIVLADAISRFKKSQGYEVFLQTGTDEHGEKIEQKAKNAGKTPQEFVDTTAAEIKRIWDLMGTEYDKFIRTTDKDHEAQVKKIFTKLYKQGDIYKDSYKGKYCTPCESFWTESQLVDGKCPDCGREVTDACEEAYFFRMSNYADRLIAYYKDHPEFIYPVSRKNEMLNNFLLPGLHDLCVSRTSFKWGIPVDFDPKHVVYVWLDALVNYITGIGYNCDGESTEQYKELWPADVHIIGKDIVRFHTIYWPIFLMALGEPLPKKIYGHPWLIQDGGKMSKSKGNVIYADDLVDYFGVDAVRYYILANMPYDNDGDIGWEMIIDKINGDLVNVFGNLVSRTTAMVNKYFGGVLENKGVADTMDEDLIALSKATATEVAKCMDAYKISDALSAIFTLFRRANKYIDETAPWVLAKDETKQDRLATVLYNLSESIVIGSSLLASFMPETAKIATQAFGVEVREFDSLSDFGLIPDGTKVTAEAIKLFNRFDSKEIMEKVDAMYEARKPKEEKPLEHKELIGIEDFGKVELRVGEVLASEKMPKADKLLINKIKIGPEIRTIVSGIAKYYTPEQMVGKKVVVVTNLKPVTLRGVLSEGMILCASDESGKLVLISPESVIDSGSEVR